MAEQHSWVPDLGYWAGEFDTSGIHHPILFAVPHDDGWVEVTSLPLVVAGRPLWQLGGARAVVLIPVLSVVLAAYAARRLSRWSSGSDGWLAFWFVGLLSPALFYATDFWEHGPALALAFLALALVLEGGSRRTIIGGLVAGLAIVMRNDMFLTFAALALAALLVKEERKRCISRWRELVVGAVASLAVLGTNALVWRAVAGTATGSVRATQRVEVAGLHLGQRARDAVITSVGVLANEYWLALMIGVVLGIAILLMASGAAERSGGTPITGVVGAVVAWGGLVWRFVTYGISTVPGFLVAAPIAARRVLRRTHQTRAGALPRSVNRHSGRVDDRMGGRAQPAVGWSLPPAAHVPAHRAGGISGAAPRPASVGGGLGGARGSDELHGPRLARRPHPVDRRLRRAGSRRARGHRHRE